MVVLAVHGAGGGAAGCALPDPDRPLAAADTVVVAGKTEALRCVDGERPGQVAWS